MSVERALNCNSLVGLNSNEEVEDYEEISNEKEIEGKTTSSLQENEVMHCLWDPGDVEQIIPFHAKASNHDLQKKYKMSVKFQKNRSFKKNITNEEILNEKYISNKKLNCAEENDLNVEIQLGASNRVVTGIDHLPEDGSKLTKTTSVRSVINGANNLKVQFKRLKTCHTSKKSLKAHNNTEVRKKQIYDCPLCNYKTNVWRNIRSHALKGHKASVKLGPNNECQVDETPRSFPIDTSYEEIV